MKYRHDREGAWAERRFQAALLLLGDALNFARDTGRNVWEYRLAMDELLSAGLTVADCRWLADKGYVAARDEAPARGGRRARPRKASFTRATRFVLTAEGSDYALELYSAKTLPRAAPTSDPAAEYEPRDDSTGNPRWDSRRSALFVGDTLIKKVPVLARNQLALLAAFQARGWPRRIDNPLASNGHARRAQALADAVHGLNRNLRAKVIRFHADEKGRSVWYELLR